MTARYLIGIAVVLCSLSASVGAQRSSTDYPQWRGPNRDGALPSFATPATWPEALTMRWNVEVGEGYATPVLIGNRVFAFSRRGENEVLAALDAATGKELWQSSYPAPYTLVKAAVPHGMGPKATPVYADGKLFTFGISGILSAFDANTGKRLWQKTAPEVGPTFSTAQSPLVDRGLLIVHVGGHNKGALTAFDMNTGAPKWQWNGDGPGYGSPIIAEFGGMRQVVTFTQNNLVGVSVAGGQLLWRRPYTTSSNTTAQTPILYKDMLIETGRGNGITAFRVTAGAGAWRTDDVWHTDAVSVHMSDAVAVDGVLFGLSHLNSGQYFALDLDTGKVLWTGPPRQAEHAALARAGNTIFSLEDDGELVVIRHDRMKFAPLVRYQVATSETWPQPAISGSRIFVKDVSSIALWTVE